MEIDLTGWLPEIKYKYFTALFLGITNNRWVCSDSILFHNLLCTFAMESLLKNLIEHVTCSICLDTFTDPKTITCLHTFCCECLKRHVLTTQQDGKFRCPECQAEIGVPDCFDKLPTGFLQNSLLGVLAVQKSGDGSEISCGNCRKKSAETSFCFECGKFMCPDCVNAHELLRNVAFEGHKVRPIKHFQAEDYEALLKRQSFCSQQYHEREVTRFFCVECQSCVCQSCINTGHKNHTVEPLDKAADGEKAKVMAGAELMKEKSKVCNDVIREFEQTAANLEASTTAAKQKVSQAAELMIAKFREREREAITNLEKTRVSRMEKLNATKTQVQSLAKQFNQAVEFANNLVQRSSSSDIMQSKKSLQKRFEDLNKTGLVPALPVSSFVKFVSTAEPQNLTLGCIATSEPVVEGLTQDFQAGVEAELFVCPKLMNETQQKIHVEVHVEPATKVGSLMTCEKEDGNFLVKFTPKVPGTYNIKVTINGDNFHKSPFTVQVKERRLEVMGELDLKGQTLQSPGGIAVNTKGLIAVADCDGHCILVFDKEGKLLQKFGCRGENAGQLSRPASVSYLNDDEILVADQCNDRIQRFNVHTGNVVKTFGKKGTGDGEFQYPVSVCIDGEGRVVVADYSNNRIQVFTKDGEPVLKFGDRGPGKLNGPTGCIFYQNKFIVSNCRNGCLKIFDQSGKFLRKIGEQGKGDGQLNSPWALCVEKCGNHHNILVCDRNNGRIVQFSVEGTFTGKTVTEFIKGPIGIAVTPDERILVTDFTAKKIYILKSREKSFKENLIKKLKYFQYSFTINLACERRRISGCHFSPPLHVINI